MCIRDRLQTVAFFHFNVDGDMVATIQAYEEILQRWPDDVAALNNLAISYNEKRRYADAERVVRRGIEVAPQTGVLWFNLMDALGRQGRFAAADSAFRRWSEVAPQAQNRFQVRYRIA